MKASFNFVKALFRSFKKSFLKIDRIDWLVFGGLILLGTGIGMMSVAWALVVVGSILFCLGIGSVLLRSK